MRVTMFALEFTLNSFSESETTAAEVTTHDYKKQHKKLLFSEE